MKKHRIGKGFYIDWSTFDEIVERYLRRHPTSLTDGYDRLVPRMDVTAFVQKEYECSWAQAEKKIIDLVSRKRDWRLVSRSKGTMAGTRCTRFLQVPSTLVQSISMMPSKVTQRRRYR